MSFSLWKNVNLGDVCKIRRGSSPRPIKDYMSHEGMPWVKISDATESNSRFINSTKEKIKLEGVEKSVVVNPGALILSNSGTAGLPKFMGITACIHDGWQYFDEFNGIRSDYLYYVLLHLRIRLLHGAYDSTMKNLTLDMVRDSKISLPPIVEQKAIAHTLSTLDEKIEVNNQINKTLENMAQAIFKQWFVDFEFPNEDGEPYKSSGGEMIESELGMIPKGWEVKDLGEIIDIHDSKRIPLSKNEREKREKIYPYYGAASLMDYVDEFIFDGIYVLLGEDGTVVNEDGSPVLQYVWGKFWVNNHAHVLSGKKGVSTNFLYILLSNLNVLGAITGAVQLKINQKNLKEMKIIMPNDMKLVSQFSDIVDKSFEKIRVKRDESNNLVSLRDSLLPKLMSGEIRVPLDEESDVS